MEKQAEHSGISRQKFLVSREGRYIRWVFGGAIAGFVTVSALFAALGQTEYLPPPPLANNLCIDEKLAFLRDHPPVDPNFLVVGSSIAWRNIDSSVVARDMPGSRPVNGAFCAMSIHQAAATAEWLIEQWTSIEEVLLIVGPQDFKNCRDPARVFDFDDASQFVFERKPSWRFYLRYFDPVSLLRNAILRARRANDPLTQARSVALTEYGDGPIETRGRDLLFGHLPKLDQLCFDALYSLATRLSNEGRKVMVVATPIHPEWTALYDADGAVRDNFARGVEKALMNTGAEYWNAEEAGILSGADAFVDAVHMRWSAAGNFTKQILRELHPADMNHVRRKDAGKSKAVIPCPGADHE